jgi:hypothetical protein
MSEFTDAEIEAMARLWCAAEGRDPDEQVRLDGLTPLRFDTPFGRVEKRDDRYWMPFWRAYLPAIHTLIRAGVIKR